jgi:hypothetical protein
MHVNSLRANLDVIRKTKRVAPACWLTFSQFYISIYKMIFCNHSAAHCGVWTIYCIVIGAVQDKKTKDHPPPHWYTRSPSVPCMSRCAQSGWRASFGRRVGVHRIPYSFSYFLFTGWFIYSFILDIKACCCPVKQLNHILVKYRSHFTCTPSVTLLYY